MFIAVPILEMIILIKVGGLIGAIPTIAMVVLTATVGIWLLKLEGLATLRRVQEKMAAGQLPETELLEGIMLIIGGALLLTPGFVTDAFGFVCLIPGLRRPLSRWLIKRVFVLNNGASVFQAGGSTFQGSVHTSSHGNPNSDIFGQAGNSTIIDGEFSDESPGDEQNKRPIKKIPGSEDQS